MDIEWDDMDTIQKSVSILEIDSMYALNTLKQYLYICEFSNNNQAFYRAPFFFNTVINSLRTDILIQSSCLIDNHKDAMSILKLLNQLEQSKEYCDLLKPELLAIRKEILQYKPTIDTIIYLRDKFLAHNDKSIFVKSIKGQTIDISQSSIWEDIMLLLNWMISACVRLRKAYGDDTISIFRTENDLPKLFNNLL